MMRLSTMWRGATRLDEAGRPPAASVVLRAWAHDAGSCAPVRYSSNFVFSFMEGGERRILRVADAQERSRAAIAAELDLLLWLAEEELPVVAPVPSRSGNLIETVETDHGTFQGVVFSALPGVHLSIEELDQAGFEAWGEALGHLHQALRRYRGASAGDRWTWRDHLALIEGNIPGEEWAVHQEANDLAETLAALPSGPDHQGLIHFDFELDNLLWGERGIGIIDFDDCAHHWYAADIAFALRDLFDQGADVADLSVQSFLRGYEVRQPIDASTLASLPVFSRLARLTAYARIMRALDVQAHAAPPPWIVELQQRLHPRARHYEMSLSSESNCPDGGRQDGTLD